MFHVGLSVFSTSFWIMIERLSASQWSDHHLIPTSPSNHYLERNKNNIRIRLAKGFCWVFLNTHVNKYCLRITVFLCFLVQLNPWTRFSNKLSNYFCPRGEGYSYIFLHGDVVLARVSYSGFGLRDRVSLLPSWLHDRVHVFHH